MNMKNLKCKLGLHKWFNHYGASDLINKFEGWVFGGIAFGIVAAIIVIMFAPSVDFWQWYPVAIGAFVIPSLIGIISGAIGGVVQDRSCVNCLKHDFSWTIWKSKKDRKKAREESLRSAAINDYEETKQFLKI